MHLSKEFFELLKSIGESKSKQEEDRIILKEITTLKKKMETPQSNGPIVGAPAVNALNANRKKARSRTKDESLFGHLMIAWILF